MVKDLEILQCIQNAGNSSNNCNSNPLEQFILNAARNNLSSISVYPPPPPTTSPLAGKKN